MQNRAWLAYQAAHTSPMAFNGSSMHTATP